MKKVLAFALVMGIASVANAGVLSMNFAGNQTATAQVGEAVTVTLSYVMAPGETVEGIGGQLQGIAGDPVEIVANGFDANGGGQPQNSLGALGSATVGTFWPTAYGSDVSFTFDVAGNALGSYELVFNTPDATGSPRFSVLGAGGADKTFFQSLGALNGSFYAFGDWGAHGEPDASLADVPRNPLILNVVPEPASLALLALGGIAVLRRR